MEYTNENGFLFSLKMYMKKKMISFCCVEDNIKLGGYGRDDERVKPFSNVYLGINIVLQKPTNTENHMLS